MRGGTGASMSERGLRAAVIAAAVLGVAGASASTVVDGATTPRTLSLNRYSLVHGCYRLYSRTGRGTAIAPTVGPFRMQAAALGIYLLYGARRQYLTDRGAGTLAGESAPSAAA